MKRSASVLAACVLAFATLGPARAADISAPPQTLSLAGNTAGYFGDAFGLNNNGNTFVDRFTFTVGDYPFNVDAIVASISRTATTGLDISGFGLYTDANALVLSGIALSGGTLDAWQVSGDLLDPGNYYLQIDGTGGVRWRSELRWLGAADASPGTGNAGHADRRTGPAGHGGTAPRAAPVRPVRVKDAWRGRARCAAS